MEYDFKDVAEKLVAGGMDEAHVNASITALKDAYASVPDEEILKKIENAGGADAVASGILKNYGITPPEPEEAEPAEETPEAAESAEETAAPEETAAEETPAAEDTSDGGDVPVTGDGISDTVTDEPENVPEEKTEPADDPDNDEKIGIISIDDEMFSDDADIPEAVSGDAEPENADQTEEVIKAIEEGGSASSAAEEFFDDDDVKVKPSKPKQKASKPQQNPQKSSKKPEKKKTSVKNMSQRAKTTYFIGLVFLIPLLIALVIVITVLFLSLYAAIIALVIASSAALVVIATVGTVISLAAIIYGVIQIAQGVAVPIGMYEIGLGIVVGGGTLCVSILLYNFIVRLAPFLFKKMFVLYKFLVRQLSRLLGFVKGACSKL